MVIAERVGLDIERLQQDMADPEIAAYLGETQRLARELGITGTPAFVIGNTLRAGRGGRRADSGNSSPRLAAAADGRPLLGRRYGSEQPPRHRSLRRRAKLVLTRRVRLTHSRRIGLLHP